MQGLMPPVNTPDKLFHDGDPSQGIEGTIVNAEFMNNEQGAIRDTQQEIINVLAEAGMQPDPNTQDQLLKAIQKLFETTDPTLTALAALVGMADKLPYFTGADTAALTDLTSVGRDLLAKTSIAQILTYLGLGTAATKSVGTGAGQIPDMSAFTGAWTGGGGTPIVTGAGWRKGPDGVIEQWGVFGFAVNSTGTNVVFPTPFPNKVESIVLTLADMQEVQLSPTTMPAIGVNSVGTSRTGFTARMSGAGGFNLFYEAKGR